ncbi:MAG: hypothetical protein HYY84_18160 [Deltaproteobacteria bacterium]|nr:hypothetical protein [Deltaproteobacteria bacterium]
MRRRGENENEHGHDYGHGRAGAVAGARLAIVAAVWAVACGGYSPERIEPTLSVPQSTGPKKRIGVVEFVDNAGGNPANARAASDALTEFLVKSKAFIVFERARMAQIMKEQSLSMSGAVSQETAVKAGELMGLNAIIVGQIAEAGSDGYETRVTVRIRLIDTTTGQILVADSGTGVGGDFKLAVNASLVKLVNNVFSTMEAQPWSGRVAAVDGGRVYINAGAAAGILAGDSLVAREPGKLVKDPVTKMVIGYTKGNVKGKLQVVDLQGEMSGCVVMGGAGTLKVNDVVELVPRRGTAGGGGR